MYKARWIEYLIAKSIVDLNYVGLANIIFEKEGLGEFHKEYLQKFDIDELMSEMKNAKIQEFKLKSKKLREILKYGAAKNVIKIIKG